MSPALADDAGVDPVAPAGAISLGQMTATDTPQDPAGTGEPDVDLALDEATDESADADAGAGADTGTGADSSETTGEGAPDTDGTEWPDGATGEETDGDSDGAPADASALTARPDSAAAQVGPMSIIQPGGTCAPNTESYLAAPNSPMVGFELDGNFCLDGATLDPVQGGTMDWSTVSPTLVRDGTHDSTAWTGGASENDWPWSLSQTQGSTNNGDADMSNVYGYSTTVGGDYYGFLGIERDTAHGTVAYYIELNKLANTFGPVPNRRQGDLRLVVMQHGGDSNTPIELEAVDVWNATSNTTGSWASLGDPSGFTGFVGGFNRNAAQSTNDAGTVTDLDGATLIPGKFMEFGINFSQLFRQFEPDSCAGGFTTLNLRSNTSQTESSSMKDWVQPSNISVPSTCSSVQVNKSWVIDGEAFANGQQPIGAATLSLTGQASPTFGTEYTTRNDLTPPEYEAGQIVTVQETVTGLPAGCTNVASGDVGDHTLVSGRNLYTVVNTVTCTRLTLVKTVEGNADPTAWALHAAGSTPLVGATGSTAVTGAIVTPGSYVISETGGPAGYQQTGLECTKPLTGSTVVLVAGEHVTCTITNTALVSLQVTKQWVVNGTTYADGAQPVGSASLTVDDTATNFGAVTSNLLLGQVVDISETVTGLPALCTSVATIGGVTGTSADHTMTLTPDPNVVAVVNTVTCEQRLTLVKHVDNQDFGGTHSATEWTLTGTGPGPGAVVSGATGDPVWPAAIGTGQYTLSESGPAGYAASLWTCTRSEGGQSQDVIVEAGAISVGLGDNVTCEITNTALPGSVAWTKSASGSDVLLAGSSWTLAGPGITGGATVIDCTSGPCQVGAYEDSDAGGGDFAVGNLHWGDYTLTESVAPPGYALDTTAHTFTISGDALNYTFADAFENVQLPGPQLPLTGGIGSDQLVLGGAAVLLLSALGYAGYELTRRRRSGGIA